MQSLSSKKVKKKKPIVNHYDLVQFKKMIGKGLVTGVKSVHAVPDPTAKEKIIAGSIKAIAMTGLIKGGILQIFEGVDRLQVINSISYADIKKHNIDLEIVINQYTKMAMKDLL